MKRARPLGKVREEFGNTLRRWAVVMLIEHGSGSIEIEFDSRRTRLLCQLPEPRRRVDIPRGANRDKQVAAREGRLNLAHAEWHLSEPHNMRQQISPLLATAADRVEPEILPPIEHEPAVYAAAFKEFAVHMAECLLACAFVEVIYVLSDQQKFAAGLHKVVFESREGAMGCVRGDDGCLHLASTLIIKVVNQRWIACKALG